MPRLELRHGNEDDHSLLATLDVHLPRRRDLKRAQVGLELASLEVEQGLSDGLLHLVGGRAGRVGGAKDLGLEGGLCEVQDGQRAAVGARGERRKLQKFDGEERCRCSRVGEQRQELTIVIESVGELKGEEVRKRVSGVRVKGADALPRKVELGR